MSVSVITANNVETTMPFARLAVTMNRTMPVSSTVLDTQQEFKWQMRLCLKSSIWKQTTQGQEK